MNSRCERMCALLKLVGADAAIITSYENRRYLSGFSGSNATLFIHEQEQELYTDSRYTEQAGKQAVDFTVIQYDLNKTLFSCIAEVAAKTGTHKVAFEADKVTVAWLNEMKSKLPDFEWIPVEGKIDSLRNVKDAGEIEQIKAAQAVTDAAFTHILSVLKPGISEIEIRSELDYFMAKRGGKVAFDTIVASGPNSSMPHAEPSERKLQAGDFVTMDFGCKLNGYCSDMTRTVAIGEPGSAKSRT